MTNNRNLKRRVRARAARTGESYTAALRHVRGGRPLRLAIGTTELWEDPRDPDALRAAGAGVRALMAAARREGARLLHLPEGAVCFPHKRILSCDPDRVAAADWSRMRWDVLAEELAAITAEAARLRLWTVLPAPHRLTPPNRPHNSAYVLSPRGLVTRYDERMLSSTKVTHLYTPGSEPVTFELDGVRFGLTLGIESHFPELFAEYERLDVDAVLFSSTGTGTGPDDSFATGAAGHAATNACWVSYAATAPASPSGLVAPGGRWTARGGRLVVADLDESPGDIAEAVRLARPWRRRARAGLHAPLIVRGDPRSSERASF